MPLPPGTTSFPPPTPPSMRRPFFVDNRAVTNGQMNRLGPFSGSYVPVSGTMQVARSGEMVEIDARILLPAQSGVRARSIVTDAVTSVSYEVLLVRAWETGIEAFVLRVQADT